MKKDKKKPLYRVVEGDAFTGGMGELGFVFSSNARQSIGCYDGDRCKNCLGAYDNEDDGYCIRELLKRRIITRARKKLLWRELLTSKRK